MVESEKIHWREEDFAKNIEKRTDVSGTKPLKEPLQFKVKKKKICRFLLAQSV